MAKQYGLIIPGLQKKAAPVVHTTRETIRPSIFSEESSDSAEDNGPPQLKMKKTCIAQPSAMERRMASKMHAKALEEDATIFQYDEVYDEIENQRDVEIKTKKNEPKKSKYIERLLVVAERRKLENELRIERQVQKERELEGEEFKDKEKFVTSAYRKKLEEMRKLAEQEKHEDYLEAIGDVTKQKDLDGFYRHLYEQKVGTQKTVQKPNMQEETTEVEISYKPIKSNKPQKQRVYRKRRASEEQESEEETHKSQIGENKVHLVNNMDADSDFSIDSSTSEDEEEEKEKRLKETKSGKENETTKENESSTTIAQTDENKIALNLQALKSTYKTEEHDKEVDKDQEKDIKIEPLSPKMKKEKIDIWKKRTVGEVFEAALKRYYERKAARNA